MTLLTQAVMVQANIDVNRMSAQQKVQLTDEIYVQQPNLLASILVLPRYGVDMQLLEEPAGTPCQRSPKASRKPACSG
jgi:hypothetical protein